MFENLIENPCCDHGGPTGQRIRRQHNAKRVTPGKAAHTSQKFQSYSMRQLRVNLNGCCKHQAFFERVR
jgi:hypothetical protein